MLLFKKVDAIRYWILPKNLRIGYAHVLTDHVTYICPPRFHREKPGTALPFGPSSGRRCPLECPPLTKGAIGWFIRIVSL
jgi:hypothetical protein